MEIRIYFLSEQITDRLFPFRNVFCFGWLVNWLVVFLIGWCVDWLDEWLVGWLFGWLAGWLVSWLASCLAGWVDNSLISWLAGCLVELLDGWLVGWVAGWLVDWLVDELVDELVGWLVGWLISYPYWRILFFSNDPIKIDKHMRGVKWQLFLVSSTSTTSRRSHPLITDEINYSSWLGQLHRLWPRRYSSRAYHKSTYLPSWFVKTNNVNVLCSRLCSVLLCKILKTLQEKQIKGMAIKTKTYIIAAEILNSIRLP